MGILSQIRGEARQWVCKVWPVGPKNENSLFVNLAGVTPGVALSTQSGVSQGTFDEGFSLNGAGSVFEMNVDGDPTPLVYRIEADTLSDIVISEIVFKGVDGGIKIQNFFAINAPLTNGVCLHWRSDNSLNMFTSTNGTLAPIKSTGDFARWSSIQGFELYVEAGGDMMVAKRIFNPAIVLRKTGTFPEDDYLEIRIQDDIDTVASLRAYARGNYVTAGSV